MLEVYLKSGGVFNLDEIVVPDEYFGLFMTALCNLSGSVPLLEICHTLTLPAANTNLTQDIPVHYLGYNRTRKTSLWVRLREAWNVIMDRPSKAYYTDENGEYANGMFKDAMRVTLASEQIRAVAPQAFATKCSESYVIPVLHILNEKEIEALPEHFAPVKNLLLKLVR
jgi:hypothetical protein